MPALPEWSPHGALAERPRERLLAQGPAALSDAELLALFLGTGVRGKSALALAREFVRASAFPLVIGSSWRGVRGARRGRGQLCADRRSDGAGAACPRRGDACARQPHLPIRRSRVLAAAHAGPGARRLVCVFLDAQNRVIAAEEMFEARSRRRASIRARW